MTNVVFRVPRTAPGLALGNDKTGLTFRKELIYANLPGESFKKKTADHDQEFTVDEDRLDHWCNVGNTMLHNGVKVPVPLKHTDEPEKNRGQVLRFERGTNEEGREALFGVIKFRDEEAAKLAASTDVSIFVPDKPVYDGFGNEYVQPIRHVCCTDYPVIPKLGGFEAIAASLELSSKPVADHVASSRKAKSFLAKARAYHEAGKTHGFMGGTPPNKPLPKGKPFGARLQGIAEVLGNPVKHLKARAESAVNETRKAVHSEVDKAMKHAVHTVHQETRAAVREEIDALKQRIKGAPKALADKAIRTVRGVPRRAFKLARNPLAVGVVGAALGAHYAKQRVFDYAKQRVSDYVFGKRKPKDIAASLELALPAKVKRQLQKAADIKVTIPRRTRAFDRNTRIITAVLAGSAIAHLLHKQIQAHHEAQHPESLSLEFNSKGQWIDPVTRRFAADPNSKSSLRKKNRELRARAGEYGGSINSTTGVPDLRTAIESAKFRINDFYHASKEELAAPANALHAAKHTGAALLHGLVSAGALIAAKRFGAKGLSAYKAHKNPFDHIATTTAALTAAGAGLTGMVDHLEAAGQHVYAGFNKRRKK